MVKSLEIPLYHSRLPKKYPEYTGSSKKFTTKLNIFVAISYRGASQFVVLFYTSFKSISMYNNVF